MLYITIIKLYITRSRSESLEEIFIKAIENHIWYYIMIWYMTFWCRVWSCWRGQGELLFLPGHLGLEAEEAHPEGQPRRGGHLASRDEISPWPQGHWGIRGGGSLCQLVPLLKDKSVQCKLDPELYRCEYATAKIWICNLFLKILMYLNLNS